MTKRIFTGAVALLVGALLVGDAQASKSEAEDCLRTKVWEGYPDGWGIRSLTSAELQIGKTKNFLVTLYKGTEYRIQTCGDADVDNLDVLIYDAQGNVVSRDQTSDREPLVEISPPETGTYYVVLYLRGAKPEKSSGGAALAVVYR